MGVPIKYPKNCWPVHTFSLFFQAFASPSLPGIQAGSLRRCPKLLSPGSSSRSQFAMVEVFSKTMLSLWLFCPEANTQQSRVSDFYFLAAQDRKFHNFDIFYGCQPYPLPMIQILAWAQFKNILALLFFALPYLLVMKIKSKMFTYSPLEPNLIWPLTAHWQMH